MTASKLFPAIDATQVWESLLKAHDAYGSEVSPYYDEVLHEISERASQCGSIGKADIGAIVFWKRLRADTPWVRKLMVIADHDVRQVTAKAATLVRTGFPSSRARNDGDAPPQSCPQLTGWVPPVTSKWPG